MSFHTENPLNKLYTRRLRYKIQIKERLAKRHFMNGHIKVKLHTAHTKSKQSKLVDHV